MTIGTRRLLAGTDLLISPLGLGCARIGGAFSGSTREEESALLRKAFEYGINVFDTADIYGQGESERLIGGAFKNSRSDVVIISKVGYRLPRRKSIVQRAKPFLKPIARRLGVARHHVPSAISGGFAGQRFDCDAIVSAVEASLRRLRTDYLDVLLIHSPPIEVITSGVLDHTADVLCRRGQVRWFGVSCQTASDAIAALESDAVSCIEVELSLLHPEAISSALPAAAKAGKGVIARQCFASGLLTWPRGDPRLREQPPVRLADLDRCRAAADGLGLPLGVAALGFALSTAGPGTTLLGAHSATQLTENVEWASAPMSDEQYAALLLAAASGGLVAPNPATPGALAGSEEDSTAIGSRRLW